MKTPKHFFLLLFLFSFTISIAQKITWGNEANPACSKCYVNNIFKTDQDGFYVIHLRSFSPALIGGNNGKGAILDRYTYPNLSLVFEKDISQQASGGTVVDFLNMVGLKGSLLMFSQYQHTDDSYMQKVSKDGIVDEHTVSLSNAGAILHYAVPNDSSSVIITYPHQLDNKIFIKSFDGNANQLWSKEIETSMGTKDFYVLKTVSYSKDGLYMLIGVETKKKPYYAYIVLAYNHTTDKLQRFDIDPVPGGFVTGMDITLNKSGDLICGGYYFAGKWSSGAGFYAESGADNGLGALQKQDQEANGSFYMRIAHDSWQVSPFKINTFGKDLLAHYMNPQKAQEGKKGIENMRLNSIVVTDDGGLIFAGEQHDEMASYQSGFQGNFTDIILQRLNPDGSLVWEKNIAKSQRENGPGLNNSSYYIGTIGSTVFVLYDDNVKNLSLPSQTIANEKTDDFKKATPSSDKVLMYVTIDPTGNVKRTALTSATDKTSLALQPSPGLFVQTCPGTLIIFRSNIYKSNQFGILQLQ